MSVQSSNSTTVTEAAAIRLLSVHAAETAMMQLKMCLMQLIDIVEL